MQAWFSILPTYRKENGRCCIVVDLTGRLVLREINFIASQVHHFTLPFLRVDIIATGYSSSFSQEYRIDQPAEAGLIIKLPDIEQMASVWVL